MSIPLVQNNEKDSINTSIIAIKRQIERINTLLGWSNSEEIDTSVFATKEELEDTKTQIETDLAPVNEVTLNNMQSVTSNAVYSALNTVEHRSGTGYELYKIGKLVFCLVYYLGGGASPISFSNIPFKPINAVRTAFVNNNDDSYAGQCVLSVENGSGIMRLWKSGGGTFPSGIVWTCSFCYITNS